LKTDVNAKACAQIYAYSRFELQLVKLMNLMKQGIPIIFIKKILLKNQKSKIKIEMIFEGLNK